jgi:hypothetical protein
LSWPVPAIYLAIYRAVHWQSGGNPLAIPLGELVLYWPVPAGASACQQLPWTYRGARWNREQVYVVTVPLLRGTPCSPDEARGIAACLLAAADPADGLEHVYAQAAPAGAGVVLFLLAPDERAAEITARSLYGRARVAGLTGYRLGRCRADPRPPMSGTAFPHEV